LIRSGSHCEDGGVDDAAAVAELVGVDARNLGTVVLVLMRFLARQRCWFAMVAASSDFVVP